MFLKRKYYKITFIIVFLFCSSSLFATPADSFNCKSVGSWNRGPSFAVFVVDSLAYIGAGWSMKIINVKDSTNPVLLEDIKLPGFVKDIYVHDSIAYVATGDGGLRIINVSNPRYPFETGFHESAGYCQSVWVKDTLAYTAEDGGFRIINVSDPASPVEIVLYDAISGAQSLYLQDTLAYVTTYNELVIINISDPTSPTQIGFHDPPGDPWDVYVQDTLAFVAAVGGGLRIINVSNPNAPFEIGYYNTPDESLLDVWVKDTLAYLAGSHTDNWDDYGKLLIINIANPSSPIEIGSYDSPNLYSSFTAIFIRNTTAYITNRFGLSTINISDPSSPHSFGSFNTDGHITSIFLKDTLTYITIAYSGLYILNTSNVYLPFDVGHYNTPGTARNVYVLDTLAFVADGDSGLRIINVSNSSSPHEVGFYKTPTPVFDVRVLDTLAYVAAGSSGLRIINVSDPSFPVEIGHYADTSSFRNVWVEDTIAYSPGHIINVSDPSSPHQIGSIHNYFEDIYIKDTLAYLIEREDITDGDFYIYNVSDPTSPVEVSRYALPNADYRIGNIWIQDSLAFVTCDSSFEFTGAINPLLKIINVADPESPHQVGFYLNQQYLLQTNYSVDVCAKDSLIYIAYNPSGLLILKYTGNSGGIEELPIEKDVFNTINISGTLEIYYSVSKKQKVKIEIFNILGQKLACPVDAVQESGNYKLNFEGQPGIYLVRIHIGEDIYKKKALLIN